MTCARREAGARRPAPSTSADSPRRPEPRPGRARARLSLLLPVLALLLGAFSLFAAAPAQAQGAPAPTNLTVTPGGGSLDVSWTAATVNYYAVAYTSNGAVAADGVLRNDGNAALGWVAVNNRLTTTSISITGLNSGTAYRVRVQGVISGNPATRSAFVVGTGTPNPTVTLSVDSTSFPAGESITLTATLSSAQTGWVTVNLDSQAGTAHTDLYTVPGSIFIGADQTTGMVTIATTRQLESLGTFQVFISSLSPQTSGGVPIFNPANGTPSSAPLTLTITASENADLAALSATQAGSAGGSYSALTLSPSTFVAATTAYTATVPHATTHVKLRVRGEDESSGYISLAPGANLNFPLASIQASLSGTAVQKTSTSDLGANLDFGPVALSVGENPITVQVTAQDGTTTKDYTVTVTRTAAAPTAPAPPTGLTFTSGDGKLDLSWTPPSGTLTGYDVHYTSATTSDVANDATAGSNPATAWVAVSRGTEADPPTASQTISSLNNGTPYRVRVRAKNAVGDSTWVFGRGLRPAMPTVEFQLDTYLVAETATTPEDIVVLLSSAQAQSVTVGISVVAAQTTATAADYTLSATSVTFAAGETSKTFTFLATADMMTEGTANEKLTLRLTPPAGIGLGSNDETEIVISDDSLTAPTLTVTPGNLSLALTWTDGSAAADNSWDVHYTSAPKTGAGAVTDTAAATGSDASAAWVAVTRTGTDRSQTISSLSNGTTYRLRVRWFSLNSAMDMRTDEGAWIFGTGMPKGPPAAPTDLALNALEDSFEVTWTASTSTGAAAPTYYEVAFDVATMTVTQLRYTARTADGAATSLTIDSDSSGLTIEEATQYRATIRACNPVCSGYAGNETVYTIVRIPANIDNVDVMPGNAQLRLSWTILEPFAGQAAPTGYDVAYTASTTVDEDADVGADPATEWVDAGHSGAVKSHTITGLTNGQEYRVRVSSQREVNGFENGNQIRGFGKGTPRAAPTVSLEVTETASEGDYPVRIIAELSEPSESDVQVDLTLTLNTAELADFATEPDSGVVFDSGASPVTGTRTLTVPAGEYNAEFDLYTEHDEDGDDETFTVTIDTTSLPAGYIAGSPTSAQVKIDDDETRNPDPDLLTGLTIHDGTRELYFDASTGGDQVGLGGPDAIYTVQVNPGIRSVTVTPVWTNSAINSIIGYVRYVTYGRDGGTVSWTGSESGTGKEVSLVDPALGAPGTTRVEFTLVDSGNEQPYVFLFQHNFDWENANNRLGGLVMRASQSQ